MRPMTTSPLVPANSPPFQLASDYEPRGDQGFGYDPIFFYPPLGCTSAEMDRDLKATVSHRARAFAALLERLAPR